MLGGGGGGGGTSAILTSFFPAGWRDQNLNFHVTKQSLLVLTDLSSPLLRPWGATIFTKIWLSNHPFPASPDTNQHLLLLSLFPNGFKCVFYLGWDNNLYLVKPAQYTFYSKQTNVSFKFWNVFLEILLLHTKRVSVSEWWILQSSVEKGKTQMPARVDWRRTN